MIKKDDLIKAMHEGVYRAHEDFERLSGGLWISDPGISGAEGFLVSKIFLAISKRMNEDETLVVELPFGYIEEWTGAEKRGRPTKGMSKGRRVDIALFNKKGEPIHVVEVKRDWVKKTGEEDIKKIEHLLRKTGPRGGGSLKSGYFSVYYQATNQPYVKGHMDKTEEFVRGLDIKGVNVKFHRKVWPAEDGFIERQDGKESQYGSHIIELSRQNEKKT